MFDLLSEDLLTPTQAAREPALRNRKTGKPVHISRVYDHILRGAVAPGGQRVKLEAVRTPGGMMTSKQAVARFIHTLTNPSTDPKVVPPSERRKQIDGARQRLAAAGI